MKKIYLLLLLLVVSAAPVLAQQQYELAQYFQNPHGLNPAFTGIEKYWQVNVGYRKLWAGSEFAPSQAYTSVNGSFYKPDIRLNSIRISRPEAYEENLSTKEYRKMNARHGLGAYYGYVSNGGAVDDQGTVSYAYHLPITRKLSMSVGAGVAYLNTYLTSGGYYVRELNDKVYQQMLQETASKRQFAINTGFAVYASRFYAGYSTSRLAFLKNTNDELLEEPVNYVAHSIAVGYQHYLSPHIRLQPSLLINYDRLRQASVYGNVKVRYKEIFWTGISYRNKEAYGVLAGFLLNDKLSLGYAYEQNVNEFNASQNGNHEVVVGFRFFRKGYRVNNFFW